MNRSARRLGSAAIALTALALTVVVPSAQTSSKKALTVDDYTKWKSISDPAISSDGKWVTYVLQTTNVPQDQTRPVLHILNLDTNQDVTVANATGGTFSADSNWIAYQIDPSPGRGRGRGRGPSALRARPPRRPRPLRRRREPRNRRHAARMPTRPLRLDAWNCATSRPVPCSRSRTSPRSCSRPTRR
jgi:hypothetical protein